MIKDLANNKRHLRLWMSLLGLSLILLACQPIVAPVVPTVLIKTPTQALPVQTSQPTPEPSPTATQTPLTFWIDPNLPADLSADFTPPKNFTQVDQAEDAALILEQRKPGLTYIAEADWVYALVAPFFTIQDDISFLEIARSVNTSTPEEDRPIPHLQVLEQDHQAVLHILFKREVKQSNLAITNENSINQVLDHPVWLILPFHRLDPKLKVISVDSVSPLDDDFDPNNYPLKLAYGLRLSDPTLQVDPEVFPQSNFNPDQLTSLIMTGVTAMARDTAYEMEIQGVLYPGTEIRDVMRGADLTHISNEVSFYEGCKFPDPDYTGFIFCSNPEYIKLLDDLGADVIELTGNHNNDVRALYKVDSVPTTLELYEQYGMQWYAGGTDITNAQSPLKIEHNGNKLAFVGCNSYGPEMAWATENSSGAAPCQDWAWLKAAIFNLKQEGYLPIVTLQYQEDYFPHATGTAIRDFRPLAEAGAVIVNGSQSHVAKAMEFYANGFIHYGLGNLFFDQPEFYITYDSFIQKHYFYQGRHISTQLLTITIEDIAKPRFMTIEERQKFLSNIFELSEELRSKP
jgi:poly-gamma-glutamate synthesis protein (capsule biosynthesis protein)